MTAASTRPVRPVRLGSSEVLLDRTPDGVRYMRTAEPLGSYPVRLTDRLDYWAVHARGRALFAQRTKAGEWRTVTYTEARDLGRSIGQALVNRGLSPDRPIAILSGNDIEHALLSLGAMYAGVPFAPISPAYALLSKDFAKLRYILDLLTPGLVFASSGLKFQRALDALLPAGAELVVTHDPLPGATSFSDLTGTTAGPSLAEAYASVDGDTVVKFLFTSGSTGMPKGVINTQRMWCSNQAMIAACLPFLEDEPPILVDWTPWNHTFGGNHDVGLVIYNGGTLYIDDGRPVDGAFEESVRNLREIATTFFLNVPRGFECLVPYLRAEKQLRERFFSRLKLMWYAGASLSQPVWDELDALSIETTGERVLMLTGLGSTETAPFALAPRKEVERAGMVGVPAPGMDLKLVPSAGKLEARVRGPNITPGYWRQDDLTEAAFDEEGFYRLGDALLFVDEKNPNLGFTFDGRLAEDFKLSSGTWVSVGPLRAKFIAAAAPYVKDVVVAGHDRDYVGVLVIPNADAGAIRAKMVPVLAELARASTGSSHRILRAIVFDEPLSIDAHEITDKGSINQKAVLTNRASLVEDLYSSSPSPRVIALEAPAPVRE
jgi:feruloyl-CoA synthase